MLPVPRMIKVLKNIYIKELLILNTKRTIKTATTTEINREIDIVDRKELSYEKEKKILLEYIQNKPTLEERRDILHELYPQTLPYYTSIQIQENVEKYYGNYINIPIDTIPPYLRKDIKKEYDLCGEYMMIRPYSSDIIYSLMHTKIEKINELKNFYGLQIKPSKAKQLNLHLLTGNRGNGKTFTLLHAISFAKKNNWAVLGICMEKLTRSRIGNIRKSSISSELFDQPYTIRQFFDDNWDYMKEPFSKLILKGDYSNIPWKKSKFIESIYPSNYTNLSHTNRYPFPDPNRIPQPSNIPKTGSDLIALGAWRTDLTMFIFQALIFEMQYTTDIPCLIAIDNINYIDQITEYLHPIHYSNIFGRHLLAPYILLQSLRKTPRYGATIISLTSKATMKNIDDYIFISGNNHQVCGYTSNEIQCALEHYKVSKAICAPLTVSYLRNVEAITGSVPQDLRSWCETF